MYLHAPIRAAGLLFLAATAAACAKKEEAASAPPAPPTVTITAADYVFFAPDTIPAGVVRVRLVNHGPSLHHVQFIQLGAGKTMDSLVAVLQHAGPPPAWVRMVSGPNPPAPNASAELVTDLAPGNYALVCFLPDGKDGREHALHGMVKQIHVS